MARPGRRLAHLFLGASELLLHIAGDLPRRHPLAAHLGHRGSDFARRRARISQTPDPRSPAPAPRRAPDSPARLAEAERAPGERASDAGTEGGPGRGRGSEEGPGLGALGRQSAPPARP